MINFASDGVNWKIVGCRIKKSLTAICADVMSTCLRYVFVFKNLYFLFVRNCVEIGFNVEQKHLGDNVSNINTLLCL